MEVKVVSVPSLYPDDALVALAEKQRAEVERLLTPEALAIIDAAEAEHTCRILFGDGR